MNQTRGLLAEVGQVFPLGHKAFRAAVFDCDEHSRLPPPMRLIVQQAGDEYRRIIEQFDGLEVELLNYVNNNEDCQRLLGIPGVGPLTASALVASVGRGQAFANPREFAVWLGLTPKHTASGDTSRTTGISKRGDRYLRTLFIHGARAALRWTSTRDDSFSQWANTLRGRCGHHKAMVAVAHKMARISRALMHHQTSFNAH